MSAGSVPSGRSARCTNSSVAIGGWPHPSAACRHPLGARCRIRRRNIAAVRFLVERVRRHGGCGLAWTTLRTILRTRASIPAGDVPKLQRLLCSCDVAASCSLPISHRASRWAAARCGDDVVERVIHRALRLCAVCSAWIRNRNPSPRSRMFEKTASVCMSCETDRSPAAALAAARRVIVHRANERPRTRAAESDRR